MWKEDCDDFKLKKLVGTRWIGWGKMYASSVAADDRGNPWIVSYGKEVFRWNKITESWENMGLKNVDRVVVGSSKHIYAMKKSKNRGHYSIYRWL